MHIVTLKGSTANRTQDRFDANGAGVHRVVVGYVSAHQPMADLPLCLAPVLNSGTSSAHDDVSVQSAVPAAPPHLSMIAQPSSNTHAAPSQLHTRHLCPHPVLQSARSQNQASEWVTLDESEEVEKPKLAGSNAVDTENAGPGGAFPTSFQPSPSFPFSVVQEVVPWLAAV